MSMRFIRRPLVLFLLPWLLALLDGMLFFGAAASDDGETAAIVDEGPSPAGGCALDPWGGCK